jgi:hypothetical protein
VVLEVDDMDEDWSGQEAWSSEYRDGRGRLRRTPGMLLSDVLDGDGMEWLWPGRIPSSSLTILERDPGLGKTLLALDLAARWTTGREMPQTPEGIWTDARYGAGRVVYFSAEDDFSDVIKPRFLAAGAIPRASWPSRPLPRRRLAACASGCPPSATWS